MARELGPFPAFYRNRDHMLRVIRNHRRAAYNADKSEYEGLTVKPVGLSPNYVPDDLLDLEIEFELSIDQTRKRPELLRSFFHAAELEL